MKTLIKAASAAVTCLAVIMVALQDVRDCRAQSATPFIPVSEAVGINPQTNGQIVSVMVNVTLPQPSPCFYITNWGQPQLDGNSVLVDAQFWASSLVPCPLVLSLATNRYDLGTLPPGDYSFVFAAWGVTVKTQEFSAPLVFSITALQTNSQTRLCWNAATSAWYRLEYCSTLATNEWVPLTAWLPGNGNRLCTNDAVLVGQPQRFYRVVGTNGPPSP